MLALKYRRELVAMHPAVTGLKRPHECTGFMANTPLKAIYEMGGKPPVGLDNYKCKNRAYWKFKNLKRGWKQGRVDYYCWSHLMHRGYWGDMDETARTERFLNRPEIKQWIQDRTNP